MYITENAQLEDIVQERKYMHISVHVWFKAMKYLFKGLSWWIGTIMGLFNFLGSKILYLKPKKRTFKKRFSLRVPASLNS